MTMELGSNYRDTILNYEQRCATLVLGVPTA